MGEQTNHLNLVTGCGLSILAAFVAVFAISEPFEYGSDLDAPILMVTGILMTAAIAAFFGLINAIKVCRQQRRKLLLVIVAMAVSIRLVALFTCPILEIDYYRYLWDGKVVAQGISPYQFSPQEVTAGLDAKDLLQNESTTGNKTDLQALSLLSIQSESNHAIVNRIHYADYTTLYPPVSQLVFGLTMKWFPDSASVEAHIFAIKFAMVLFDLATMAVVLWILGLMKFHPGWLILYAWNPLVIKEVANGGHLDSIATFFLTLSVLAIVKFRLSASAKNSLVLGGGVALGLGIGAKLSPVVLFPALAVMIARRSPTKAILFSATCFAVAAASLWPMLGTTNRDTTVSMDVSGQQTEVAGDRSGAQPKLERSATNKNGLAGFLSKWRMNDPIFSPLYLNLKSQNQKDSAAPWFVVSSGEWRERFCGWMQARKLGGDDPAYFATRGLTLGLFAVFYLWQLLLMFRSDQLTADGQVADPSSHEVVANSLSRLAWIMGCFLILQPTVNPWYFVWIAPLTCFTNNRAWLLASGLMLVYYARFWFKSLSQLSETWQFSGYEYSGAGLFDHFIVFVEFALIVLLLAYFRSPKRPDEQNST